MDARRNKLKYRAWHRGFVEADLILGPFADTNLPAMAPDELDAFERLLETPDHDLYAWIVGPDAAAAEADAAVLQKIRDFRFAAHQAFGS